jgi:dienelactone hydrolase
LASLIGAMLVVVPAAAAYDETENWLNSYGHFVDDNTSPERHFENIRTSLSNQVDWLGEIERTPSRSVQQTGGWPWNGDSDRGSYDQQGNWTGIKIEFEFRNDRGQALAATMWGPTDAMLADRGLTAPLPGIVYSGGFISSQPMYYWFAQEMARNGYVVMTYDVSGQGRSEGNATGNAPQDLRNALDFFTSTPDDPYERPIGDVAYNPLYGMLDRGRVGTAGHSMGASAVQTVADHCGVVKAISAHSDLHTDYAEDPPEAAGACGLRTLVPIQGQGADYETFIFPPQPTPGTDPEEKLPGFRAARDAGVDTQELVIESASHLAWSHVFGAYTASWSEDVALHYALAWFDRYLYGDMARGGQTGTERLTNVFSVDAEDHGVSKKYRSAYALGGDQCEDMVAGCGP